MSPGDWSRFDLTGIPPRRRDVPSEDELEAAGWNRDWVERRERDHRLAEHHNRLEQISPDEHLEEIRGETS